MISQKLWNAKCCDALIMRVLTRFAGNAGFFVVLLNKLLDIKKTAVH